MGLAPNPERMRHRDSMSGWEEYWAISEIQEGTFPGVEPKMLAIPDNGEAAADPSPNVEEYWAISEIQEGTFPGVEPKMLAIPDNGEAAADDSAGMVDRQRNTGAVGSICGRGQGLHRPDGANRSMLTRDSAGMVDRQRNTGAVGSICGRGQGLHRPDGANRVVAVADRLPG